MGDSGIDHVTGNQPGQKFLPALFLGFPAGQNGNGRTACILCQLRHHKTHRTVDPGQNGNIPHGALPNAHGPLLPGNDAPNAVEVENQIVLTVTDQRPGFQNFPFPTGLQQRAGGQKGLPVFLCIHQPAFRIVFHVYDHSFHWTFSGPVCLREPAVPLC